MTETEPPPREVETDNPRLNKLVEQILELNMLEVSDLTQLLSRRLGLDPNALMGGGGGGGGAPAAVRSLCLSNMG